MTKTVLVPVADGTEELEAVTVIDVLRRAGADVTVAGVNGTTVSAAHGVRLTADVPLGDCVGKVFDLIVLPGGMPGAENLSASRDLQELLKEQYAAGRWYAAICASPAVVLAPLGLLAGLRATCYPGFEKQFDDTVAVDAPVVLDGRCVTGKGPGTALAFALKLAAVLCGEDKAGQVAAAMVAPSMPCCS